MNIERSKQAEVSAWFNGNGYALRADSDGTNCNLDLSDCYDARVMPTISTISESSGSASGGQMLTLTGTSLYGNEKVEVSVDGVPCLLQSFDATSITCETLPK